MSEYLQDIIDNFEPMDHMKPDYAEMEDELSDDPSLEEIREVERSLTTKQQRGGAILTVEILNELNHLSIMAHERIDEMELSGAPEWSRDQKDDIHLFFAFVGQAQEHLLRKAVLESVISDSARTESMKKKIMSDNHGRAMSAYECLDYLHRAGVIDSGLKGEISQTRNERNEAVHDLTRWLYAQFDTHDLQAQVNRGERSVVKLLELVYGFNLE